MIMYDLMIFTMVIFQNTKKYFKRAELARKEEEEYFKRCGYTVS